MFDELHRRSLPTMNWSPPSKDSVEDTSKRKTDPMKRLQTKVSELALLLREKDAKLNELSGLLEQKSNEYNGELEQLRLHCAQLTEKLTEAHVEQTSTTKTLLKTEQELECYRKQVAERITEVDQHRLEIAQLREENKAKQSLLDEARVARNVAEGTSRGYRSQIDELTNLNDEQRRQIESLTDQLSNVMLERSEYRKRALEETAHANDLSQELENLRSQLSAVMACSKAREYDLQDHISLLEQRLTIFTTPSIARPNSNRSAEQTDITGQLFSSVESEPDSVIGDSLLSDDSPTHLDLSLSSATSSVGVVAPILPTQMESDVALGAGDIQTSPVYVSALLRERNVLTTRLEAMRVQLIEAKTQWSDCLVSLERQIARLNRKLTQDAEEHEKQRLSDQVTINQLKREVTSLRQQLDQANNDIRLNKDRSFEQSIEVEKKTTSWLDERVHLLATITSLTERTEQIACERNNASEKLVTLEQEIATLKLQSKDVSEQLSQREQELELAEKRLREITSQLTHLQSDHELCERRLGSMSEELGNANDRIVKYDNQLKQFKTELNELNAEKQHKENALNEALEKIRLMKIDADKENSSGHNDVLELEDKLFDIRKAQPKQGEELDSLRLKLNKLVQVDECSFSIQGLPTFPVEIKEVEEQIRHKDQIIRVQQKRLRELQRVVNNLRAPKQPSSSHEVPTNHLSPSGSSEDFVPLQRSPQTQPLNSIDQHNKESIQGGSTLSLPTVGLFTGNNNFNNNSSGNMSWIRMRLVRRLTRSSQTTPVVRTGAIDNTLPLTNSSMLTCDPFDTISPRLSDDRINLPKSEESINSHYLRHVVIKFLLSREREALHLVRVLTTLLGMNADEERLLRLTLQSRQAWFPGGGRRRQRAIPPSLAHGQFAKIIPPS